MKSIFLIKNSNKIMSIAFAVLLFSLSSCKKWVAIADPLSVDQKTLFSNEQGFVEAMNGIYLQMGSSDLYGRELNYGLLSILGRSYDTPFVPAMGLYYEGARYNFDDPNVRTVTKNIWTNMYSCIANLNNVLVQVEENKSVFKGNNYNIIKGEALGLRAFLHFELLRLFAPNASAANLSAAAIPYVQEVSPYAAPVATVNGVLELCIADLTQAKELLPQTDKTPTRFNHWSAKGILARLYLYKGDTNNANTYAQEIINSKNFPLSVNNTDLMFPKESLFSINIFPNNLLAYKKVVFGTPNLMGFTVANQTALYVSFGGSANDWRKMFVDPISGFTNLTSPRKWNGPNATITNAIPLLRASEIYYIAAECANLNNDATTAKALLDTMRVHRNLPKYINLTLTPDSINNDIRKEYQKEFLAEGQVFFFYKRKNLSFSQLPYTKVPVVSNASYVLPKGQ